MCVPPTPLLSWDSFCVSPSQPKKRGGKINAEDQKVPGSVLSHTQNAFVVNIPTLPVRQKQENEAKTWGENNFFTTVAQ
jgi:hypothetical protein